MFQNARCLQFSVILEHVPECTLFTIFCHTWTCPRMHVVYDSLSYLDMSQNARCLRFSVILGHVPECTLFTILCHTWTCPRMHVVYDSVILEHVPECTLFTILCHTLDMSQNARCLQFCHTWTCPIMQHRSLHYHTEEPLKAGRVSEYGFNNTSSSSPFICKTSPFFHAKLGLDVSPRVNHQPSTTLYKSLLDH